MRENEQYYGCFPFMICGNSNLDNVPDEFKKIMRLKKQRNLESA